MIDEDFINLENEIFCGNILDIGLKNYGIVYNVYKYNNNNFNVEYIKENDKKYINNTNIEENFYDCCVLFLCLSSIMFNKKRQLLINDICKYLKDEGFLYIWDINKGYGKVFSSKIKIKLPDKKVKEIFIKDLNILKNNSKESTLKMLVKNFNLIDLKSSNNIYYIKAQKKRRIANEENESYAGRD